jgi:hypothetical protein
MWRRTVQCQREQVELHKVDGVKIIKIREELRYKGFR